MQRGADIAAQLPRGLVRLVPHRAQELANAWRISRDAPCNISLHQHAQPIASSHVLQARRSGSQTQVYRNRALERCRKLPGETRLRDHARWIAEAGDDAGFAGRDHDYARGRDGCQQDRHGDGDAQLRSVVIVIMVVVIIVVLVCKHQ